ncbi:gluconate 2-dehydrogenase subunit 3 family protein [Rhizobium laguerreae]|uniref:gluconate 2-dehydrogenase subunit 3 family protein n=1 Tax=Rhizobium laguerreae TaxID=1076926 RepID=UPI00103907D0|nr:gluconate 2-dehydrogenase subunit 3 family protein [Rhizobium laguerreae]TBX99077.1 gluconate 2-dehydrogenase subunit 3 family protein [Rhizobium laguerreae]
MTTIYELHGLSRRELLKRGTIGAALIISGRAVISPDNAWGLEVTALKPDTMATLVSMARDTYPHDQLADRYYAIALKGHDSKAGRDAAYKTLIEEGVADLDKRAGTRGYRGLKWEDDRVAILRDVEKSAFFQAIRSDLVVSLYNQKEIWPVFGYEGESYSKGGYIERGFNDIEWL